MATTATIRDKTREQLIKEVASLEMEVRLTKDQLNEVRRIYQITQSALDNLRDAHIETLKEKVRLEGYVARVLEQDKNELQKLAGNA